MLQSCISAAQSIAHLELTGNCRNDPHRRANKDFLHNGGIGHVSLPSDGKKRYDGNGKDGEVCRLVVCQ
jgi:hypothetical protein